jgi:hypothetical protein
LPEQVNGLIAAREPSKVAICEPISHGGQGARPPSWTVQSVNAE